MHLYSEPCERNKEPIFQCISEVFAEVESLLEIGSGTGQHALYMAEKMPHLNWQMTDFGEYYNAIKCYFDRGDLSNILPIKELDVRVLPWQQTPVDMVYTANSLHIMGWDAVEDFFTGVGQVLKKDGYLFIYGPFKYSESFTSPSNAKFDLWLKNRDAVSGIRNYETVNQLAQSIGLKLVSDTTMPANNQGLLWQRD